jgi:hypothetical protein
MVWMGKQYAVVLIRANNEFEIIHDFINGLSDYYSDYSSI